VSLCWRSQEFAAAVITGPDRSKLHGRSHSASTVESGHCESTSATVATSSPSSAAPTPKRRARTDQEDFQANIPYDALGYGCGANAGADAMTLVHGGPRCRTVFVIDRHGRLEVFYTIQARYVDSRGVRVGMPTAIAERLLRKRVRAGCFTGIWLSSPQATMTVSFDGGTIRHNATLRGGHVSVFVLHGLHDDTGLFECQ
jgi:hypothetical protein